MRGDAGRGVPVSMIISLIKATLDPRGVEEAVREATASRNLVFELDHQLKYQELAVQPALRATSPELAELKERLNQARVAYAAAEARMEAVKARHAALVAVLGLLAAHIQAGKDTAELEAAVSAALGLVPAPATAAPAPAPAAPAPASAPAPAVAEKPEAGEETASSGTFKVLEVRSTKTGATRAWCEAVDSGQKTVIYGKNGAGKALTSAVGKIVEVRYIEGDAGLIALSVRLAG